MTGEMKYGSGQIAAIKAEFASAEAIATRAAVDTLLAEITRLNAALAETNKGYWVTYGRTESDDDLQVFLWKTKPTGEMIDEKYSKLNATEFEEVGYVNWVLEEITSEYIIE